MQKRRFPGWGQLVHLKKVLSESERLVFRIAGLVFIVSFVWSGWSLFTLNRVATPAVGGRYVEALVGSPEMINPLFSSLNDVDSDIARLIYSGLVRYDVEQRLVPDLATHYSVSEDKKTYTFSLRRDVVWHDGQPFTALDVVQTFERIQNPEVGSPLAVSFSGVEVKATDDFTVEFVLKEPFPSFLSSLTVGIIPAHVWQEIPPAQTRLAKPNLQPIGTGPFRFKKFLKQDTGYIFQYELERFDRYYQNPPFIKEFVFAFFGSFDGDFGAIEAVREHKVDGVSFVSAKLRDRVEKRQTRVYSLQLPQYSALFFNPKRQTYLEQKDVRQALAIAIDRDRIIRESLQGEGAVINSPILPGYPGFRADIAGLPYSPTEANTLLDKVWKAVSVDEYKEKRAKEIRSALEKEKETILSNTSTSSSPVLSTEDIDKQVQNQVEEELSDVQSFYRQDKEGSIVEIRLVTADTPEYNQAAKLIAGFWRDIGVKTTITTVDPKTIKSEIFRDRKYDVLLYGVIVGSDPDQFPFWHSTQVNYPGLNLSQYVNRKVDALLETARETTNDEERLKAYEEFQTMIVADLPAVFLYTPTYRYVLGDDVQGFRIDKIFHPSDRFANITEWYIKTKGDWKK